MVKGWFTPTRSGASVMSSDGLFAASATSPIWVSTHRPPFWKPSCAGRPFPSEHSSGPKSKPGGGAVVVAGGGGGVVGSSSSPPGCGGPVVTGGRVVRPGWGGPVVTGGRVVAG